MVKNKINDAVKEEATLSSMLVLLAVSRARPPVPKMCGTRQQESRSSLVFFSFSFSYNHFTYSSPTKNKLLLKYTRAWAARARSLSGAARVELVFTPLLCIQTNRASKYSVQSL